MPDLPISMASPENITVIVESLSKEVFATVTFGLHFLHGLQEMNFSSQVSTAAELGEKVFLRQRSILENRILELLNALEMEFSPEFTIAQPMYPH